MKSTSVLSALALAVSVAAAPLAAEQIKPKPTTSTQGGAVVLGALSPAAIGVLVVVGVGAIAAVAGGGSSDDDSTTSTPSTD